MFLIVIIKAKSGYVQQGWVWIFTLADDWGGKATLLIYAVPLKVIY